MSIHFWGDLLNSYNDNNNYKCNKCNLTIHPNFINYHRCGYANCPICKNAVTNSQYWPHVRSHPGHENDSPPPRREPAENKGGEYSKSYSGGDSASSRSFNRERSSPLAPKPVEVGKEYELDITEISIQGDGIARVQGFVVFVKNAKRGQKVKVKIEQVGNRSARATMLA